MTTTGMRNVRASTARRFSREKVGSSAAALLVLLALEGGVPTTLLSTTGMPWPAHLPTAEQVGQALLAPDDGHLLAAALVGIAWLGWVAFTAALAQELVSQLRGVHARRLPGLGHLQELVARLIAAAVVLTPAVTTSSLSYAAPAAVSVAAPALPTQPHSPIAGSAAVPAPDHRSPSTPPVPSRPSHAGLRLYVVQPSHAGHHDTLWSIAANHLGDPLRWPEIAELNRDRPQPDGGRLTDPHWIRPGWRLLMPPDATGLPLAEPPVRPAARDAGDDPGTPLAAPARHAGGLGAPAAGTGSSIPPAPARDRQDHPAPDIEGGDETALPLPIDLAVMGVLAAGLLAALARLRAVQRRHRRTGERTRRPGRSGVKTEVRLRAAAEPAQADAVTAAVCALAEVDPAVARHVQAAELTERGLAFMLDEPVPPPAPFTAAGDDRWLLPADHVSDRGDVAALPALVSMGYREGHLVFVDVERLHVLSLVGDVEAADRLLAWMAADLAVAGWSATVSVTLIGVAPLLMPLNRERVRCFPGVTEDVVSHLERHADQFTATGCVDALATRGGDPLEPWPVEIMLIGSAVAAAADATLLDRLFVAAAAAGRNGCTVVVAGVIPGHGAQATITGGILRLPTLRLEVQAAGLNGETVAGLSALARAATELDSEPAPDSMAASAASSTPRAAAEAPVPAAPVAAEGVEETGPAPADELDTQVHAFLNADPECVRVRLLGPVEVAAPGPLETKRLPTSTELVVFLACSPHGATLEDISEALWPERLVPRSTRNAAVTRARTWMGTLPNGEPRLSRVDSAGRVRLREALVDWYLFERLVARAGRRTGSAPIEDLRCALQLVSGKPFASIQPGRYAWLAERNLEEEMSAAVVDAAHTLAGELLTQGDPKGACDAAHTALMVDRYDERPWRDLLQAEATLGRMQKVREHLRTLMDLLEVEVTDELLPETADLIARLLPREGRQAKTKY